MLRSINKLLRNNGLIIQYIKYIIIILRTDLFSNHHIVEFLKDAYNKCKINDVTFISNGSNDVVDKHISKNSIESVIYSFQ